MHDYMSMAATENEIVDCRTIQVALNFFDLPLDAAKELALLCIEETEKWFTPGFYLGWSTESSRRVLSKEQILQKIKNANDPGAFLVEGDVESSVVWDKKSFLRYGKYMMEKPMELSKRASEDYREVQMALFDPCNTPEDYREAFLQIYRIPGKRYLSKWFGHDLTAGFFSSPMSRESDHWYGSYDLRVARLSLGSKINELAEQIRASLVRIAEQFPVTIGRIGLSPISAPAACCEQYMECFPIESGLVSLELRDPTRYPNRFLCGIEWFTILSPQQKQCLPNLIQDVKKEPMLLGGEFSGGQAWVQAACNLDEVDIDRLIPLKRVFYPALYPGRREINFQQIKEPQANWNSPRRYWQYVPIFENEVIALEDRLVLQHPNNPIL